ASYLWESGQQKAYVRVLFLSSSHRPVQNSKFKHVILLRTLHDVCTAARPSSASEPLAALTGQRHRASGPVAAAVGGTPISLP
ncbi:hypothetical protein E2562_034276, partial [Oryza meyeriana var. granulata]